MHTYDKVYINGEWVTPQGQDKAIEVFDSTNEQVMATIPSCNAKDVDAASKAAAAAFLTWSALDVEERAKYMNRIGDGSPRSSYAPSQWQTRDLCESIFYNADC